MTKHVTIRTIIKAAKDTGFIFAPPQCASGHVSVDFRRDLTQDFH
jgi:hypothetical protein